MKQWLQLGLVLAVVVIAARYLYGPAQSASHTAPVDDFLPCQSNLGRIQTGLKSYYTDHHRYPETLSVLTPRYLVALPTCPTAHAETYSQGYSWTFNPDRYTVSCAYAHHGLQPKITSAAPAPP